ERRRFRDYVEKGERRTVGNAAFAPGRDPRDRPRNHEPDEELVALVSGKCGELEIHLVVRRRNFGADALDDQAVVLWAPVGGEVEHRLLQIGCKVDVAVMAD